ncbi:MAG: hypothetical protein NZ455_07580 [Bacteroidia bacterium]|nr:hypothetical protein [Bacteroidia bacterium]
MREGHGACPSGSTKRSEVPKRSVVRNAPTLAQQGTRPRILKLFIFATKLR